MHTTRKVSFSSWVTDLEGHAQEREWQSWMLGNFTFSLPGPGKLPVDCECSHLKTSISTFFPFLFSFWFPFPGLLWTNLNSPTFPSHHLRHKSFSNPSVASPTSQFILQPFFRFFYATSSSLNSAGEPPMIEHSKIRRYGHEYWKDTKTSTGLLIRREETKRVAEI